MVRGFLGGEHIMCKQIWSNIAGKQIAKPLRACQNSEASREASRSLRSRIEFKMSQEPKEDEPRGKVHSDHIFQVPAKRVKNAAEIQKWLDSQAYQVSTVCCSYLILNFDFINIFRTIWGLFSLWAMPSKA